MMKQIPASAALVIFLSLSSGPMFALADSTTNQIISAKMNGFAFANGSCCPDVSSSMNGIITTRTDGTTMLSQQSGNITIGSETYRFEFIPSDKTIKEIVSNDCSSSQTYQQDGKINMVGSNGTTFTGSGVYSWGTFPSCTDDKNTFTNFSGNIQDSTDPQMEFYTGTNSLPSMQ